MQFQFIILLSLSPSPIVFKGGDHPIFPAIGIDYRLNNIVRLFFYFNIIEQNIFLFKIVNGFCTMGTPFGSIKPSFQYLANGAIILGYFI